MQNDISGRVATTQIAEDKTESVSFTILRKSVSWNVLVRQNFWKVKAVFDAWKEETGYAVLAAHLKPIPKEWYPVRVHFFAAWKHKRRHDIDSLIVKPILDTLTVMDIWPDDSSEYVGQVLFEGVTGAGEDSLTVTISPI